MSGSDIVCIDTGKYCDAMYYGQCVHSTKLICRDGTWHDLGAKSKEDIIVLHMQNGLMDQLPKHFV